MIRVGQVMGPYGLDGAVKVMPLTDFGERFDPGARVMVGEDALHVEWSREGQPGRVVKLRGVDNRTMAQLLSGRYLEIPEDERKELEQGRFYHRQVVGLSAITQSGAPLGLITEVLERPANDVWVSREGNVEHLIPAVKEAVLEVDLAEGRVVVADWLLSQEDAKD